MKVNLPDSTLDSASSDKSDGGVGTVIFLGTGTSVGVPAIGCTCDVCQSVDPHNKRLRCSIVIQWPNTAFGAVNGLPGTGLPGTGPRNMTLLVDTPPDLRTQLLRENIPLVNAVLYTHEHADHLFGLDDLRLFPFRLGAPVPLYCQSLVEQRIRKSFDYAFHDRDETHPGARPRLEFRTIDTDPFDVLGIHVVPIPMLHGPHFNVLGFRFGDFAYCTDTNGIPDSSMQRLAGVRTLVIGALRHEPHATHFNVEQAVEVAKALAPETTYLTHISHDLEYVATNLMLPPGVHLSYDGLRVEVRFDKFV